ncbi:MAG: hypothetical protein KKF65_06315, partial [Nanoarchaeota archaeon]|nr:hypothetical protein [Nanoarchaeota archaeon]
MRLKHKSLISLFLIVILAVVILLLPFLLRYSSNNPLFVRSSYYNIRASEDLSKGLYWDYLQDRPHEINLFTYIASTLSSLGTNFLIMFSIILCVVSIIVFYLILTTFISDRNQLYIAIVLFVASPMFLFLF